MVGLGVVWAAHLVPFQPSANVASATGLLVKAPTAVHALAAGHDTPARMLPLPPLASGDVWIVQLAPFQRSARVSWTSALVMKYPTAVHAALDVHDTPLRLVIPSPVGFGVAWSVQLTPFQRSANGTSPPLRSYPTAVHALIDAQDTLVR